jgi:hypothetical protein
MTTRQPSPQKPFQFEHNGSSVQCLEGGISVAKTIEREEDQMNDRTRLPERKNVDLEEFPCRSCGETFNSLEEAEQHEKDCRNRKTFRG